MDDLMDYLVICFGYLWLWWVLSITLSIIHFCYWWWWLYKRCQRWWWLYRVCFLSGTFCSKTFVTSELLLDRGDTTHPSSSSQLVKFADVGDIIAIWAFGLLFLSVSDNSDCIGDVSDNGDYVGGGFTYGEFSSENWVCSQYHSLIPPINKVHRSISRENASTIFLIIII